MGLMVPADKAPEIYQKVVQPHVEQKVTRYVAEVHKTDVGVKYLSGKARMTDYIKSPETENTYLFYIQVILEAVHRREDYEYKGLQGMNMVIIVDKDKVIYSTITRPYWIHRVERRLI
jgi:hypothetical protein